MAALAAASVTSACSKQGKPSETAQRVQEARGEMKGSDSLRAHVVSVDQANKTVLLVDDAGHRFAIEADEAAVATLQPNDEVKAVYQEAVAFALQDPRKAKPAGETKVEESTEQLGKDGVQYGRRITTTVQIVSVSPGGAAVEFRVPEGAVRTVAIEEEKNRQEIANLRPGDSVQVTYTEKLKLSVHEG